MPNLRSDSSPPANEEAVYDEGRAGGERAFRRIHARFARNVLGIYLAVSVVALGALVAALVSDLRYQRDGAREALSVETELRAQYLASYLNLLADEVRRLGERPEIDLLDQQLGPERTLLDTYRGDHAMFNRGFALLDEGGGVMWSSPANLFEASPVAPAVFSELQNADDVQLVPSDVDPGVLLVASPIRRSGRFTGALLAVIDLAAARAVDTGFGRREGVNMALATRDGRLIYPAPQKADPRLAQVIDWEGRSGRSFLVTAGSDDSLVVAGSAVPKTSFMLLSTINADLLVGPVVRRLVERLIVAVLLSALPLLAFSVVLSGSLRRFRVAEEEAIRSERMRSLGEAASLIAHEVRNSLNSLRLGLDVVLSGESPESGSRRAEILKSLRGEMHRLADFTTDLLTFSRGVTPHPSRLDLDSFTRKIVDSLRPRAESRNVRLEMAGPDAPLPVDADLSLVHVILSNVIGNAIDFSRGDGDGTVTVEIARAGADCLVRVSDNGPGVALAVKPRLFEPFVTGRTNGVGIGLALSRRIARAHGGDLRLVDRAEGACFELILPGASA